MNPLRLDASLYELATTAEAVPLQVSPTIFKSMVATLIDVVIDRQINATLWLKLPRGEAWYSEFDRLTASAQSVYVLGDKPPTAKSIVSLDGAVRLRREYFLLVQSPQFTALVLAHRLRVSRSPSEFPDSSEEELERKQSLMAIATCDRAVIDRVVGGLAQVIAGTEAQAALQTTGEIDLALVSAWLAKQIQRQAEIWHSSTSSRRQAETAMQLRQENTAMLESLRHKDEFLKTLGQELRTPLTTMKTALSLLGSPTLKPPQRQRYMDMLTQAIDRQSSLITSVLDLVQLEDTRNQPSLQPLRLADVVPGVVSTYQPLAQEKGVMLAYTISEELPPVACLNPWLRQIVINLLHNGIKFTSAGGQVWVKARQQDDFVELEISDTGVGIASSDLHRIFDRFYSVRQSSDDSGAGLGLSIVQQLLDRCGGSISVKSKPAEGAAFRVLLPIHSASGHSS
ncbi:histidine kinase [Microcoleus sp. FACHB-1515]|uniref:ATP-binding protein n=1 Tax=Cyanophyceae TaxID=3028117 RepID=UPI001687118C|nr:ATP-binding protein [Microcoleus sp. FACHB-1515]MBD2089791.1 histidine kinase [Microcoleus sp. FACHB-1515]